MTGIHDFLRASAERDPSHPVFIQGGVTCSYAELESASGRLAAGLAELGVKKGERVALLLDGDADFLIAYYGVAKAGAVVVALCPDTRRAQLVHALADSGAAAIILDSHNTKYLANQSANLPELRWVVSRGSPSAAGAFGSAAFGELLETSRVLQDAGTSENDLLSITYTSGTTGRPKGVMLTHRNLMANLRSIVEYLALTRRDRVAMVLPFYYVYGNSVLHTHVYAGASIVHAGSMTFPAQVLKTIETMRCTGFSGVPASFARLTGLDDLSLYDLSSLRYVTQAGAAMTPALTQRLRRAFPHVQIFVMYGQTEAAARLAYLPPEDLERKLGSAGKAIPGVQLKVLDPEGQEAPRGTLGEIAARGDNVMLGYWKDPDLTARVLRGGQLHTGDLGRMDDEGFLFISGRGSEMIKAGAHRISPREIEEVIERIPGVRECAVVGIPDDTMGQLIAAFIVPTSPGPAPDRRAILRACLAELPRFKLPHQLEVLSELPRTQSGKVRKGELVERYLQERSEKQR